MEIKLIIPNDKLADFGQGFLKAQPIPTQPVMVDGEPTGETEPAYSAVVWFKMRLRDYALREYRQGKKMLANEAAIVDNTVIE